tara:strand:+ start:2915 stop:4405 length:1491 start_codon:yes stop_codon:yes gene_type:complete
MIEKTLCATILLAALSSTLWGTDHFLTIAGGYEPSGNQVSLEKNVVFYRNVLARAGFADSPHAVYFANGLSEHRDVQYEPSESQVPRAHELMAKLFGTTEHQSLSYRKHKLTSLAGATTPENLAKWFDDHASTFQAGDRLILYATAHGGKSNDKKDDGNTRLYLWNKRTVSVSQLQPHLEKLPAKVGVTLIMAQCYSGGFANSVFNNANKEGGDFDRPVCGFFSTVPSRQAAGCTPDIDEEDYDEFSSHFWAAIHGETRVGQPVESADYDENGAVSFEEAFAYTVITSQNIDIPIRTSGVYLRARSKYRKDQPDNEQLFPQKSDYESVLALANPVEAAMLEALSSQLNLTNAQRYAESETAANQIEEKRKELKAQSDEKKKRIEQLKKTLQRRARNQWPELSNILSPTAVRLLTEQAEAFIAFVESQPEFAEWVALQSERDAIEEERFVLEKEWAKHIRFLRTHNNVILAKNLVTLADQDSIARYHALVDAERKAL